MGADARKARGLGLTVAGSSLRSHPPVEKFVRLAHLRKLRKCEQVAAVCYRVRGDEIELLLIRTRGSRRWTFPKGGAERGLTHAQAAALEAFEEAGVHGRIEEAAFLQYVRHVRHKRGETRDRAASSAEKGVAVNAHLCEVLRLSTPAESKRDRTWFSVEDAKQQLREGRESRDGAVLVRVIERAVERIQRLRGGAGTGDGSLFNRREKDRTQPTEPARDAWQKDALQKVPFEFREGYGRADGVPLMPYIPRQLGGMRQSRIQVVDGRGREVEPREVLQAEVLHFSPREKKARALGSGASLRG